MISRERAVISRRRYLVCMVELSWRIVSTRSVMYRRFMVVEAVTADVAAVADVSAVEVGLVAVVAVALVDAVDAEVTGLRR